MKMIPKKKNSNLSFNNDSVFSISALTGLSGFAAMMLGLYKLAAFLFFIVSIGGLAISWYLLTNKAGRPTTLLALSPEGIKKIKSPSTPTLEEIAFAAATHAVFFPLALLSWSKGERLEREQYMENGCSNG